MLLRWRGKRLPARLGWTAAGLIIAWDVGQGSLLRFPATAGVEHVADAVFFAGVAVSLAAHEFAQGVVSRAPAWTRGGRTKGAGAEIAVAAVGPLVSLLLALLTVMVDRVAYVSGFADPLIRALAAVATFNIVLAGANLLPALPLDAGRLLRAVLGAGGRDERRAARIAGGVGEAVALAIVAVGVASALGGDLADAFSTILLGVVLFAEGRATRQEAFAEAAQRPLPRRKLTWPWSGPFGRA